MSGLPGRVVSRRQRGDALRLVVGFLSRLVLVLTVLIGITLIAHLYLSETLSSVQFRGAMVHLTEEVGSALDPLMRSRSARYGATFALGVAVGWAGAIRWMHRQSRNRSLVIADLRHADISFQDAIRHVRRHAVPSVDNDSSAISMILGAARRGRLTLWRQTSADTMWRVPARSVSAIARRFADIATNARSIEPWQHYMLLGAEMERMWPRHSVQPIIVVQSAASK